MDDTGNELSGSRPVTGDENTNGDGETSRSHDRHYRPYQSDRVYENPSIFPPDENVDETIGGTPEEQAVLREEQST